MSDDVPSLSADTLRPFLVELLQAYSVFEYDAETITDAALLADGVGHHEAGVVRIPVWIEQIVGGQIDPRGRPLPLAESPALYTLDGSSAVGPVAAAAAADWTIEKAPTTGVAVAVVKNGRDLGCPMVWAARVAAAGLIGLCVTGGYRADSDQAYSRRSLVTPGEPRRHFGFDELVPDASKTTLAREAQHHFLSPLPMLAMLLAGGRDPEQRHAAPNPHQSEHVVVALDPGHGLGLDGVSRTLDREYPHHPPLTVSPDLSLPPTLTAKLSILATDRDVAVPF